MLFIQRIPPYLCITINERTQMTELFKSSYSNPVADLLKQSITEKNSEIKKIIDEIIASSISSPEFKTRMADVVITKMVENSLRK